MAHTHTLTSAQLKRIRSDIERQLAQLLKSTRAQEYDDRGARPETPVVVGDVQSALQDRRQQQLAAAVSALQRLDTGEYGECVSCGNPIPYGRLVVMPETTVCIACGAG